MSYPSATKPTTCEKLSSDPLYANMKMFVPCYEGAGAPRDVYNNLMPQTYSGAGGANQLAGQCGAGCGVGRFPYWISNGFNSSYTLRFQNCAPALAYTNASWTATQTKRTLFIVFQVPSGYNFPYGTSGGQPIVLLSAGMNGGDHGIGIMSASATTFTVGLVRSNQFISPSANLTLQVGRWYALAVSSDDTASPSNRLYQCYDYTAQALVTNSGNVTTDGTTHLSVSNSPNATVNSYGLSGAVPVPLEVYCFGLHSDYWDTTSNNLFPGFYQDPVSAARGTYTASGALTAGSACVTDTLPTTIGLSATRASGIGTGGTGSPTYQWYRSQQSNDTPGSSTMPAISGATGLVYTDAPPSPGVVYFYKLVASDGTSQVTYPQVYASLDDYPPIKAGFVGDSITLSNSGAIAMYPYALRALASRNRAVTVVNMGVFGSSAASGTSALSWQPSANTIFTQAMNSFGQEGGITYVWVMLGANDCSGNKTAAQFQTDLGAVVTGLISNGYKAVLDYPTFASVRGDAQDDLLRQYQASINAIVAANPGNCYLGDTADWRYSATNQREWNDGLHPQGATGGSVMGDNRARSMEAIFGPPTPPVYERVRQRLGDY